MLKKCYLTLRWAANHPINQGPKWKSAWNFIRAQLGARMILGELCVPFPNDTRLLIPPSMKGATHFIWPSLVDFEEMSFLMHFLRPDDLFVDVGANIGAFTVLASGVAGAKTIAYEPGPSAFEFLQKNIWLNHLSEKATAHAIAVGAKEGMIYFTTGLGTENHMSENKENTAGLQRVEVPMSTLDAQFRDLSPTVIKIDVEGFESDVLTGAKSVLSKPSLQALVMECVGNAALVGRDESDLPKYLESLSFVAHSYEPTTRSLKQIPAESARGNVIYLKNPEFAKDRVRSASAYRFANRIV